MVAPQDSGKKRANKNVQPSEKAVPRTHLPQMLQTQMKNTVAIMKDVTLVQLLIELPVLNVKILLTPS